MSASKRAAQAADQRKSRKRCPRIGVLVGIAVGRAKTPHRTLSEPILEGRLLIYRKSAHAAFKEVINRRWSHATYYCCTTFPHDMDIV